MYINYQIYIYIYIYYVDVVKYPMYIKVRSCVSTGLCCMFKWWLEKVVDYLMYIPLASHVYNNFINLYNMMNMVVKNIAK